MDQHGIEDVNHLAAASNRENSDAPDLKDNENFASTIFDNGLRERFVGNKSQNKHSSSGTINHDRNLPERPRLNSSSEKFFDGVKVRNKFRL